MLNTDIKITGQTRLNFLKLLADLNLEELNRIPDGFNNNLLWNFGHIIITQQLLTYGLSGLEMPVEKNLVEAFRKGAKPTEQYSQSLFDDLKQLSSDLLDRFERDVEKGIFTEFNTYPTSFNVTLESFEESVRFNTAHEALHLGYAMSLKRSIKV